jgi:hypothetical protein
VEEINIKKIFPTPTPPTSKGRWGVGIKIKKIKK